MAGVSASHLIIFIASLVIAAGVVGTLTTGVERVNSAIDDRSLDVTQQVRMDMAFVSDPGSDIYSSGDTSVSVYVRNTGSQGIPTEASAVDVVFNGQFITNEHITVEDANDVDSSVWRPNDVVNVTVTNVTVQDGDNRLVLLVNEDEELFEFRA